MNHLNFSLI